jgi:hypothetical protein
MISVHLVVLKMRGNEMKKFTMISGVALLAVSLSGTAFAQGANPSAPQPSSTGTGVIQPGTTSTGTATDAKMKTGKTHKGKKAKKASGDAKK